MVTLWLLYYATANAVRWLFRRKRVPVRERVTIRAANMMGVTMTPQQIETVSELQRAIQRGMAKRKAAK